MHSTTQWQAGRSTIIGIHLHLPMPTLKEIDAEHQHDPHKSLIRMLELCLKRVHPPSTQTVIIDTVKFLGEKQLAAQLTEKYIPALEILPIIFIYVSFQSTVHYLVCMYSACMGFGFSSSCFLVFIIQELLPGTVGILRHLCLYIHFQSNRPASPIHSQQTSLSQYIVVFVE